MTESDLRPVLSGEGRHVLVVEDDGELRPLLLSLLRRSGFRATGVRNGVAMREVLVGAAKVDLVLLDVMLPGRSGFELCRDIRAQGDLPVILLTALGEASDRVIGLELGADDYVAKPPDPRELVARIRAVLRRREGGEATSLGTARDRAIFGGWTLDTRRRELTSPGGGRVELTSGEYDLLLAFVERPQRVLSREQLLDLARGRAFGGLGRSIDAQISRLRGKLGGRHDEAAGVIKTLRGVGYMLARDVEWQ
ncbi:response regulator transcription factor [Paeniroseomonas aquatica]|uniref:Response regulator transcription factor n=1 Tax=Paeniroseomonas aquatica TaxID=373043 RepID=A0ABT8AGB4_9PROT|nr:response regulator transcription factor [Paeniroseomonas aquatica]MDN3568862.1 response regulator transcription factor [Paeniroseomonas aquatica]